MGEWNTKKVLNVLWKGKYLIIILLSCFITLNIVSKNKSIEINNKFIALSFDDGPSIYTDQILDIYILRF